MSKYGSFFFFLILCTLIFSACNDNYENANQESKKNYQTQNVIQNSIIGKWGGLGEATPVWDIRKDSIYYFQHFRAYAYEIINNNMIINFGKSSTELKDIHIKNDTLYFIDDLGLLMKGYRFK